MADLRSLNSEWPAHFRNLCREVRGPQDARSRDRARGGLWLLLNSLISQYLRFHITRQGRVPVEDLEDIAAEKSLDLLRKNESGTWDAVSRPTEEIKGFLSKVARNGLVDRLRAIGRHIQPAGKDPAEWQVDNYHAGNYSGQVAVSNGTNCTDLSADKVDGNHVNTRCTWTVGGADYIVNTSWLKIYGYGTSRHLKIENPPGAGNSINYAYALHNGTPPGGTLNEGQSTTFDFSSDLFVDIRVARNSTTGDVYVCTYRGLNKNNGYIQGHVIYDH